MCETKEPGNRCSEEKGISRHNIKPPDSCMCVMENVCHFHEVYPNHPCQGQRGPPRDHVTPGPRGSRMENSWDHSQDPLMNMQTQIDLFPVGMSYYSQILIRLQIPPVPLAFPTAPLQARTLAPRRLKTKYGQGQKKGHPGFQGVLCQDLSNKMHAGQGEPRAVHLLTCGGSSVSCHWALLSCPGQFTAWYCSSGRRGGNRPCHT